MQLRIGYSSLLKVPDYYPALAKAALPYGAGSYVPISYNMYASVKGLDPFNPPLLGLSPAHKELQHRPRQFDPKLPKQATFCKCLVGVLTHDCHDGSAVPRQLMLL
jgi:hypothetical protein